MQLDGAIEMNSSVHVLGVGFLWMLETCSDAVDRSSVHTCRLLGFI